MEAAVRAIADPTRRALLELVQDEEQTASHLASQFALTRPAVSQHLRVLADAQLVTVRSEGTRRYYRARPEGFAELSSWLGDFWGTSLRTLKIEVERDEWNKRLEARRAGGTQGDPPPEGKPKSSKKSKKSKKKRGKKHKTGKRNGN